MDVKKVKKTMAVGPKKGKELYGLRWVNYGSLSSEVLLEEVDAASTFSDSDSEAILKEFVEVVMRRVANGHSVDLGVLGTLKPKISAKAVNSEAECTAETIQTVGLVYQASTKLSSDAKKMSVNVISISPSGYVEETTDPDEELEDDNTDTGGTTPGGNTGGGGFEG